MAMNTPTQPDPFKAMGGGVWTGQQWVDKNHPLAKQAQPQAPSPVAPGPQGPQQPQTQQQVMTGQATVGATPQQGSQTNVAAAYQSALLNRLAPAPVTPQSANVQGAMNANRLAEQRGFEQNRALMAERAAAQGLDQNAFNSGLMGLAQGRAGREAAFEGNLLADAQRQQDQQAMQAMALAGGGLGQLQGLQQQQALAELSAQLTREGLAQQGQLGGRELDLRGELGRGNLNLGLLSALLGNQQHGQSLGAQMGMFGAQLNQQALLSMLGAL